MKLQKTNQEEYDEGDLSIDAQKYVVNDLSIYDSEEDNGWVVKR